jgi:hypothetical protein
VQPGTLQHFSNTSSIAVKGRGAKVWDRVCNWRLATRHGAAVRFDFVLRDHADEVHRQVEADANPVERARRRGFSPARVYREQFQPHPRRERMFIGSLAFFAGFGGARVVTHAIRAGVGPFHDLALGGRHLHHLVFGIGGLLGTGYLWLLLVGTDVQKGRRPYRATAAAYGLASALTLDELALWLNLEDVYWARQGRESVDAVAIFGSVLSVGLWGGPFLRGLARELRKLR